ncbi:MAG TPA: single-stranded-DNA-specific exonuclease RecJ, partial [Thermodesulfobacteriota bacterium]|nr:single-stranded-DNA-specific exonuclease RecJ [Thermodesulfobacteriota bacterium]
FESAAAEMLGGGDGVPVLEIDALTRLEEMNASFLSELKSLAPFGAGNPEPVLAVDNLAVADSRPVGKGHLRLRVKQGRHFRDVIAFGMGARHPVSGEDMRMAFVPCAGTFNGQRTLRMKLIDLYPRGDDEKEKNRCQEKG